MLWLNIKHGIWSFHQIEHLYIINYSMYIHANYTYTDHTLSGYFCTKLKHNDRTCRVVATKFIQIATFSKTNVTCFTEDPMVRTYLSWYIGSLDMAQDWARHWACPRNKWIWYYHLLSWNLDPENSPFLQEAVVFQPGWRGNHPIFWANCSATFWAPLHGLIRVKLIQIDSNDRSHRSDKIARELCGT